MAMHMARCSNCGHREATSTAVKFLRPDGPACSYGHVGIFDSNNSVPMLDAKGLSKSVEHSCAEPIFSPVTRTCKTCGFVKPGLGRLYHEIGGVMMDALLPSTIVRSRRDDEVLEVMFDPSGQHNYLIHRWRENSVRGQNDDEFNWG